MCVMGLTGSVLVFRPEFDALAMPAQWRSLRTASPVDAGTVIAQLLAAFPGMRMVSLSAPNATNPTFVATLAGRTRIVVASDPQTGDVLGRMPPRARWLAFVLRLHETLLIRGSGRMWNGVGAAFLLLLAMTGLVNWWPGVRSWTRALKVNFRFGWRRINFDLHRAVGFWAVVLLSFWALTGMYFAWPEKFFAFVNSWSPIVSARPPSVVSAPGDRPPADVDSLITEAVAIDPGTRWGGIFFPFSNRAPIEIIMRRAGGSGREYEDTVYFNPYTGEHLATWRYGVNQSVGDWLLWLQVPLHFGTSWGTPMKAIWATFALTLPLLAITGAVMYWNRVLRHRIKRARQSPKSTHVRHGVS